MNNQETRQRAKKKVEAKIGFRIHLTVYVVVIALLVLINLTTSTEYIWFKWPLMGWGIAVIIHALGIFNSSRKLNIKEQMIENEIQKEAAKEE